MLTSALPDAPGEPPERSRREWLSILKDRGIQPSRSMGQNFLVEPSVVRRIVETAGAGPDDLIVEIGPGMGILTRALLQTGAEVVAVELDRKLKAYLDHDLREHRRLRLVERDARHVDIADLVGDRPYKVAANLPYSVATVVIRHFVGSEKAPAGMTVMVQREVAERMVATPPAMSLLSLATQLHALAEIAFLVPRHVFVPPPKVESAVVQLTVHRTLPLTPALCDRMFELATMAFQRKRKTLSNGLSQGLDRPKRVIDELLESIAIDPRRRPQTLEVREWQNIATALPE